MGELTLRRIYDRMVAKLPEACASGSGADLLIEFFEANARDLAESVYLRLSALNPPPTEQEAEDFAADQGLGLIKGLAEVNTRNGFTRSEWTERAERASLTAYAGRLFELLATTTDGGRA